MITVVSLLAGDDVGVGDDQVRPAPPSPSPRSRARRRCRARAPPNDSPAARRGRRRSPGSGGPTARRLAGDRGRRIDPVERVQHRPRGRQHFVEAAQDHRALDVGAQAAPSPARAGRRRRRPRRGRARPRRSAQRPPLRRRGAGAFLPDHPRPQPQGEALQGHRRPPPRPAAPRARRTAARRATRLPGAATRGPIRLPRNAPTANPTSVRAPTIKPCRYPQRARATVKATIPQSSTVTAQIEACWRSLYYLSPK